MEGTLNTELLNKNVELNVLLVNTFIYFLGSLEGKSPQGFSNAQNSRLI